MADTESLITEWEASRHKAHNVAAGIARKTAGKNRYDEPPPNSALSAEYDVSERTVSTAKSILRDHGMRILENGRYYIALSPAAPAHQENRRGTPHARIATTASASRPWRAVRAANDARPPLPASQP